MKMKTLLQNLPRVLAGLLLALPVGAADTPSTAQPTASAAAIFAPAANGGFTFDTGVLRGQLRPGGKSLGLTAVTHVPSGKRLDRSNGLLSHYRVFANGTRYGGGAWDWPSQCKGRGDGAMEVRWEAAEGRPFTMRAIYSWKNASTIDLETVVRPEKDLTGFESFLASYFENAFTNAAAFVARSPENQEKPGFLPARSSYGDWLMFPRETAMLALINDGRWKLEPNPVTWTIMPTLAQPLGYRRDPVTGLTVVLMSPPTDCFALACPHQTEGHYSLYLSLFGRTLKAGEEARARTRLMVLAKASDEDILKLYQDYLQEIAGLPK